MAEALMQNNINDDKMYIVNKLLNEGKTKFEAARAVGYRGVDGLDRYAKSLGYVWNVSSKNYELREDINGSTSENPPARIMKILSMVDKCIDLNDIAKYFKMKNSQELAEYMKNKGYVWNVEKGNYVKRSMKIDNDNILEEDIDSYDNTSSNNVNEEDNDVDILKLLESNKGKLIELLSYKVQNTIPRYMVKGIQVTKSFYISTEIDRLLKNFSYRKDISQKDIIHTALIEYFEKYGYKEEVGVLLKS